MSAGTLRKPILASIALVAVVGSGFWAYRALAPAPGPAVILITVDTLRADYLSGAGHPVPTSPALDAFLREGTAFDWCLSTCSYTIPSHASMLVGNYPSFHSAGLMNGTQRLLDSEVTLAELCRDRGLRTAAVVSNLNLNADAGLAQGFERYDDDLRQREPTRKLREQTAPHAVDKAIDLLGDLRGDSFFLWLHLQDPHGPYTPPRAESALTGEGSVGKDRSLEIGRDQSGFRSIPPYQVLGNKRLASEYRARYEREIRFMDGELGRLFEELEELGLRERTLVVLTADHGEALGEDKFFFSHSHSVSLDQVHVPLGFVGPGVRANARVSEPVSNLSVFATILEFLGVPAPSSAQSVSLLPTLTASRPPPKGLLFTESYGQRGIVRGRTYLRSDRRPPSDQEFWAFNPVNQSYYEPHGPRATLLGKGGAREAPLDPELEQALATFQERADRSILELDEIREPTTFFNEAFEELRALGYVK